MTSIVLVVWALLAVITLIGLRLLRERRLRRHVPAVFQTTAYSAANNLNQYVNVTVGSDPAVTLGYDANGNLTGDGAWTFAYDAQNMLRTATKSGTTAAYAYDTLGRRQAKTVNAVVTTFLHDGDEEIAEYDGANTLLRRYVPGPGTDMPIAMVTPSGGTNTRAYFHTNRQGSTIAMSADNGTVSEGPYTYDAYGNGAPTTGVPFKYTGRRLDPETGLYYYRARYYSAAKRNKRADDDLVFSLTADPEKARTLKTTLRAAVTISPKKPYFARGSVYHKRPTRDAPYDIEEEVQVVIADITCAILMDREGTVLATRATR